MSRHLITRLSWVLLALALVLAALQAYMLLQAPEASPRPGAEANADAPQARPEPTAAALTATRPHPSPVKPEQNIVTMPQSHAIDAAAPYSAPHAATAPERAEREADTVDKGTCGALVDGRAVSTTQDAGAEVDTNNTQVAVPNALRSDTVWPSPRPEALKDPERGGPKAASRSRREKAGVGKTKKQGTTLSEPVSSEALSKQAAPSPAAARNTTPGLLRATQGAQSLAADFVLYREQLEGIDSSLPSLDGSSQLRFTENRAVCMLHWQSKGGRIRELSADLQAAEEGGRLRLVIHLLNQEVCRGAEVLDLGLYLIRLPESEQQAAPRHEQIFLRLDASQPTPLRN